MPINGKLWVLYTHRRLTYAATFKELDVSKHSFFYGCDCGAISTINEDQFLCREDIVCGDCKQILRATWEWTREMIDLPR